MHLYRRLISFVLGTAMLVVMATAGDMHAQTNERCFPETGMCIVGRIREYWEQNGGLPIFGLPITPQQETVIEGKPLQVQWFERNRLELHPENARPYDVLLGRLGVDRLTQLGRDWFAFPKSGAQAGCRFFPETGHNICGDILTFWDANSQEFDGHTGKSDAASLALFGLPVSDMHTETIAGKEITVQWFERARVELHPENAPAYKVLLGRLGSEVRTGTAETSALCADVPDPVSARIRPSKCVMQGETVIMDIFGFQPNEEIAFWLTQPDGRIIGTIKTINTGPTGNAKGIYGDVADAAPGLWYFVFQGTSSKHQAIIYFKVLTPKTT